MTRTALKSIATLGPALALAGIALTGCSSTLAVAAEDVATQAAASLESQLGYTPEIECAEDLDGEVGAEITCDLYDQEGTRYDATMTVTNVDGSNVEFDVNVPSYPTGG